MSSVAPMSPPVPAPTSTPTAPLKALAFDIFGTVVDWHGGVMAEAAVLAGRHGIRADWSAFANDWRAGYAPAMDRVRRGELPWTHIDRLHRMRLDELIQPYGLQALGENEREQLNRAWHRLPPWADAVTGLTRLKREFTLTTLSNGNFSLLTDLARHGGLPWDCIMSAELFGHYKPDPETYLGCARLLDLAPAEVMLVACHPADLRAAQALGLRTAYVRRPLEHGPATARPTVAEGEFDLQVDDFNALADRLLRS